MRLSDLRDPRHYLLACRDKCSECLYSGSRIVSDERAADLMRRTSQGGGTFFICHKGQLLDGRARVVCGGWIRANKSAASELLTGALMLGRAYGEQRTYWINTTTGALEPLTDFLTNTD